MVIPFFCALLDGEDPDSGFFSIDLDEEITAAEQSYDRNTAIVRTMRSASQATSEVCHGWTLMLSSGCR
jgi:hypothetical protein